MYRHRSVLNRNSSPFFNETNCKIGSDISGNCMFLPDYFFDQHTLVTGRTGSGKSNFLKVLTTALSVENKSLTVIIDPHGDTARHGMSVFGKRTFMLALGSVEIGGKEYTIKMNPLSTYGVKNAVAAGMLKDVFSNSEEFSGGTWGPRLELILGTVMQHLTDQNEDSTLGDLAEILMNQRRMKAFLSSIKDERLSAYMKMQMNDWRGWNGFVSSSLNKIIPLVSNPLTMDLVNGRRDSFDLAELTAGSTLLVPEIWNSSMPGGTAAILSSLIILKLWAFAIGSYLRGTRVRICILVDEAQLIPQNILMKILTEGRKYGISMIMATQQVPMDSQVWKGSILGNVGNTVSFSSSDQTASLITSGSFSGPEFTEVRNSIISLEPYRCILWSKRPESISGPVTCKVAPAPVNATSEELVRRESIMRYGSPRVVHPSNDMIDLHESLIGRFSTFLEKKGIELNRETRVNGWSPDGTFQTTGTEYLLEVEVSDLSNFSRITGKLIHYWDRKKVFLAPEGFGSMLFNKLIERIQGTPPEDREMIRKYLKSITRTTVCEFDQRPRIILADDRLLLNLANLDDGSFISSIKRSRNGKLLMGIFQHFLENGIMSMRRDQVLDTIFPELRGGLIDLDRMFPSEQVTLRGVFEICRK